MTAGAWALLAGTWSVVIFFAARFLLLVIRRPSSPDDE